ncbi:MAG TPA: ABC transporter permease subunit [Pirellulales bacterium]|jgi:polar amino acid transport system substrate-binding protein|nr:ABC transporter permease subunit [Pirellulales bacterium]
MKHSRLLLFLRGGLLPALLSSVYLLHCNVHSVQAGDALDEIHRRGTLIWGADQEGGGPYIFPDPKNPEHLIGFEVELADMLAQELGVKAKFYQGQWEELPQMLDNQIDLALNGFERTPARLANYLCTRPYYAFGLQLMAKGDGPLKSWNQLKTAKPDGGAWKIGVLGGSEADEYLTKLHDHDSYQIEVISYSGNTEPMEHVQTGVLDATVADDCVANFYIDRFPQLNLIEWPAQGGYYVGLVGRNDPKLLAALNEALRKIIADGRLKALYDRWDLDGRYQMLMLRGAGEGQPAEAVSFWQVLVLNLPMLLEAAGMTVLLSVVSFPLAIAIGIGVAIGRLYGPKIIATLLGLYVEVLRGTPLMLQLFVIFFLFPKIGLALPALVAGIAGLAINYSAYESEIYRAGLQAIPRGQMEAALALGLTPGQAIHRIILPQAFRIVIPPVTNDFIALFKDTSVCSVITIVELTKRYSILAQSTGAIVQLAAITAVLYMLMSFPLSVFSRWSERRLSGDIPSS